MQGIGHVSAVQEPAWVSKSDSSFGQSTKSDHDQAEISQAGKDALSHEEKRSSLMQDDLSPAEQQIVEELKQRDQAVRQHEQAHKAVGGAYAIGAPHYQFMTGPDGQRYAVAGHVNIDVSKASDPEETIRKMEVIKRAAMAPVDPSSKDHAVASQAQSIKQEAMLELRRLEQEERLERLKEQREKDEAEAKDDEEDKKRSINETA